MPAGFGGRFVKSAGVGAALKFSGCDQVEDMWSLTGLWRRTLWRTLCPPCLAPRGLMLSVVAGMISAAEGNQGMREGAGGGRLAGGPRQEQLIPRKFLRTPDWPSALPLDAPLEVDMRRVIVLAALFAGPAEAAPIELECQGQTNIYDKGSFSATAETVSVTLDFASGTVTIGNRSGRWTVPMVNRPNEDMVTLAHRDVGVTMGSINRITGVASFGFALAPGFGVFNGICQRAQNLF
jgi:hypothetical protein